MNKYIGRPIPTFECGCADKARRQVSRACPGKQIPKSIQHAVPLESVAMCGPCVSPMRSQAEPLAHQRITRSYPSEQIRDNNRISLGRPRRPPCCPMAGRCATSDGLPTPAPVRTPGPKMQSKGAWARLMCHPPHSPASPAQPPNAQMAKTPWALLHAPPDDKKKVSNLANYGAIIRMTPGPQDIHPLGCDASGA